MSINRSLRFMAEAADSQPDNAYADYRTTAMRAPRLAPIRIDPGEAESGGPIFSESLITLNSADLTRQSVSGEPIGQRIVVTGRVLDESGAPVPGAFLEIWQANAAGRYHHDGDQHNAPLDPHFKGIGRVMTDREGSYQMTSIKPGSYPWRNHENAWRPAHIHFSVCGPALVQRLITQMYFPGDPLLGFDPIFNSVKSDIAKEQLIAKFDLGVTEPEWALGYRFDIVLRGPSATPSQA